MYQLGNAGLVLSHSFASGTTFAFLHGWSLLDEFNKVTGERMIPHIRRIRKLLRAAVRSWTHPLLIPVILLEEHLFRANSFRELEISRSTVNVEFSLGVTHSGRIGGGKSFGPRELREFMGNEKSRIYLTSLLNTTVTDAIGFTGVLKWDFRYCEFLDNVCDEIQQLRPETGKNLNRVIKEAIAQLQCFAQGNFDHAESLKARLNLQLSVV